MRAEQRATGERQLSQREPRRSGAGRRVESSRFLGALASGALALTAVAPAAAFAQEPDAVQEGAVPPDQRGEAFSDPSEDADPGGDDPLPVEEPPAPYVPRAGDTEQEPLEEEPPDDPTYPPPSDSPPPDSPGSDSPRSDAVPPVVGTPPSPPPPTGFGIEPVPPADPAPPPAEPGGPDAPPPADDTTGGLTELVEPEARGVAREPRARLFAGRTPEARAAQATSAPRVTVELDAAPAAITASPTTSSAVTATAGRARDGRTQGDARVHVVKPGESLWVIAERTLGGRPSAAAVAREVERLWALNDDRIGTGDPDRLMAGTELRLR